MKTCAHAKNLYISGNNPDVLQKGRWLNKLWYIHTVEYYSAIKRKELFIYVTVCIDLKWIMLSGEKVTISKKLSTDFHYITFLKWQNYGEQLSVCIVAKSRTWLSDWTELNWWAIEPLGVKAIEVVIKGQCQGSLWW